MLLGGFCVTRRHWDSRKCSEMFCTAPSPTGMSLMCTSPLDVSTGRLFRLLPTLPLCSGTPAPLQGPQGVVSQREGDHRTAQPAVREEHPYLLKAPLGRLYHNHYWYYRSCRMRSLYQRGVSGGVGVFKDEQFVPGGL